MSRHLEETSGAKKKKKKITEKRRKGEKSRKQRNDAIHRDLGLPKLKDITLDWGILNVSLYIVRTSPKKKV